MSIRRFCWALIASLVITGSVVAQTEIGVAVPPSAGGSGTVTSVALTAPTDFSVAGSPVTDDGTIALTWASQNANLVFGSPNGLAGSPTFRSLVAADIPTLPASKISGTAIIEGDSRLTDQRAPTAHASTHASAGSDPVTLAQSQVTNLPTDLGNKQAADSDLTDLATAGSSGTGPFVRATGNIATATALAANPADCSAGQFANAIAANGDLTCVPEVGDVTTSTAQMITGEKYKATLHDISPDHYRSWFVAHKSGSSSTSLLTVGGPSNTVQGTASSYNDATGAYLDYVSAASLNSIAGSHWPSWGEAQHLLHYAVGIKTGTDITNIACYFGISASNFNAFPSPIVNSVMISYDTAVDGTAFWRMVTNDGSGSATRTVSSVAVAADTRYNLRIITDSLSSYRAYVNNTLLATVTTDLPDAATVMNVVMKCQTLDANAKSVRFSNIYASRN